MIRRRDGNAAKDTIRCPQWGFENLRPQDPPSEQTMHFTCRRCGFPTITAFVRRDLGDHPQDGAAFQQPQARISHRMSV